MTYSPLKGIVPPLVTPLTGRDSLDVAGLERLIEKLIGGGVNGLFVLGTTGEGPSLSYRLRREVIERSVAFAAGRVPVMVGITDTAFVESVALARHCAEVGVHSVVAAPPYYLPEGQPELLEYTRHLISELPLPLFIYNMPALTKVSYDVDTITALRDEEGVIGIKDSSGNMTYFHQLCRIIRERPDWSLLIGPEELLVEAVLSGGHGGVNGGANLFPELYVGMYEAVAAGDLARAWKLHEVVMEISGTLYKVGRYSSSLIKGLKCALALTGVCDDFMAEPFHRFRGEEKKRVEGLLVELQQCVSSALA